MIPDLPLKYIDKIGVEYEGGWLEPPPGIKKDYSVTNITSPNVGEICSVPSKYEDIMVWTEKSIPQQVNASCGLHIHVSFLSVESLLQLTNKDFYDYFSVQATKWGEHHHFDAKHPFWTRLGGGNAYCSKSWIPEEQLAKTQGHRLTQFNFAAYSKHGTVECRVFPAFSEVRYVHSAINLLLYCYETWLSQQKPLTLVIEDSISYTFKDW